MRCNFTVIHFENCLYEFSGPLLTIIMSPKPKTSSPYLFHIEVDRTWISNKLCLSKLKF